MKKIKWGNFGLCILLIICIISIIQDFYIVAIEPFFTGILTSFTFWGIFILFIKFLAIGAILSHLEEEL
jgi:hypothetical protein